MHTGALHQLHNAGQEHLRPVADRVNLDLSSDNILINQHRRRIVHSHGFCQVFLQHLLIGDDFHRAAAQNKSRPHQNGIADFLRGADAFLKGIHRHTLRMRNAQFNDDLLKRIPVLCGIDGLRRCPDHRDAPLRKRPGQIDGRLPAQ